MDTLRYECPVCALYFPELQESGLCRECERERERKSIQESRRESEHMERVAERGKG